MMDPLTDISALVNQVVRRHLRFFEGDEVPPTQDLATLGLDSMRAINLLLDLEDSTGTSFPDELLTVEVFQTRESLERAVRMLLA